MRVGETKPAGWNPRRASRSIDSHLLPSKRFHFLCRRLLNFSPRFLASQLKKDLFEAHRRGPQFIEFPAGCHHRAREIAAHEILLAFNLECVVAIVALLERYVTHTRDLRQTLAHIFGFEAAITAPDFNDHGLAAASTAPQIADRIRSHDLTVVMMTTCSQVCSTSGRMCVLRIIV